MSSQQTIELADGRRVCLSYGVPVAAFIPNNFDSSEVRHQLTGSACVWWTENICPVGMVRTDRRFSVTTSRHMNAFAGHSSPMVPDDIFCALVHPLNCKR